MFNLFDENEKIVTENMAEIMLRKLDFLSVSRDNWTEITHESINKCEDISKTIN